MLMSLVGAKAFAYDIAVENSEGVTIYYNYINDGKELEVTYRGNLDNPIELGLYKGVVVIPEEVTYMNRTRKVTRIGDFAFFISFDLTFVTIPNSVTSIGDKAFESCSSLTSVTIPNNVTSLGKYAFRGCSRLTSINIPNSVTSIDSSAFSGCSGLTSVTIPNSVTSIGEWAFGECESLTSVAIPTSVTSIGDKAFYQCSSLTSVAIPASVTSIGAYAFKNCSSLTSVTIPNSVISIGDAVWVNCTKLSSVISLIEYPFKITGKTSDGRTFDLDVFNNVTLYIPVGTIDKYKSTEGWKDFLFIEEGTGPDGGGETPETKKCATPTIGYQNGKLVFNCDTEGATCQSTITDTDISSYSSNEVQLGVTYNISVYATKVGYEESDVATATLCWIDVDPKTEGITNIVSNVRARAILIQSNGNQLTISGAEEGSTINVFDMSCRAAGSAKASAETTTINTTLRSGDIGIVKIGDKAVKVLMK